MNRAVCLVRSAGFGLVAWGMSALPAAAQHNAHAAGVAAEAAQRVRAVRVLPGVQVGGVLPSSDLGNFYSTGLRVGATLTAIVPTQPYGVRLALTYDRLSGGTVALPGQPVREVEAGSMVSVTVAGLYTERADRSALLYATGGIGVHRLDAADTAPPDDDEPTDDPDESVGAGGAETKFGATIGGGLTFRIGGLPSYLEVQVVKLFGADAILVPLVVGIQLGR